MQQLHPSEFQNHLHQRFRMGLLVWLATGLALALGLSTLLNDEYGQKRKHWISTSLIGAGLIVAGLGRLAHENAVESARIILDHADISAASRQQLLYEQMKPDVAIATLVPISDIDPDEYLSKAASSWRTHLGVLSPTDTGKSTVLMCLLSKLTTEKEAIVLAIEPKGAKWEGVPKQNVLRVPFRPTLESAVRMIGLLTSVLDLAQARVDSGGTGAQIIVVVEEWLSMYATLKGVKDLKDLAETFKSLITSFAAVGRGCGCQLVLISQSPNVEDLGISGGVRRNFRLLMLGSQLGGFEAIDAAIDNGSIVSRRYKERIDAEYQSALAGLKGDRHPLIMTNLIGDPKVFPAPFLSEPEIKALKIQSLVAPPRLLGTGNSLEPMPAVSDAPIDSSADSSLDTISLPIGELKASIIDVLSKATKPLLASEIRKQRRALKVVPLELLERILKEMVVSRDVRDDGSEDTPRYFIGDT